MARTKPGPAPKYEDRSLTKEEQDRVRAALLSGKAADMAELYDDIPGLAIDFAADDPGFVLPKEIHERNQERNEKHAKAVEATVAGRGSLRARLLAAQGPINPVDTDATP